MSDEKQRALVGLSDSVTGWIHSDDTYGAPPATQSEDSLELPNGSEKIETLAGLYCLQNWITGWAIRKGWTVPGDPPRDLLHQLMLVVSELSEAVEAHRAGNPRCDRPNMGQYSHVEEELADAVIRLFQMAGEHGFRLSEAIISKMEFNETRPHKHGKLC